MKVDPHFSAGELLQAGLVASGIVIWFVTVKADTASLVKDVARHERMLDKITQTENTLSINQSKVSATLEGIRELIDIHMRVDRSATNAKP